MKCMESQPGKRRGFRWRRGAAHAHWRGIGKHTKPNLVRSSHLYPVHEPSIDFLREPVEPVVCLAQKAPREEEPTDRWAFRRFGKLRKHGPIEEQGAAKSETAKPRSSDPKRQR